MSDRHGWGALLPVYNIPETFGNAISYEGQLHWFLENWNEVAEYANDLEQPTVTVGTVATPESNDVPPSVAGVAEGTDLTLNFTLPDKMIKPLGAWSASVAYESLSLVNDGGGNTYISKQPSPAGTPLTDSTIWMQVGVSSANYIPITGGTITGNLAVNGTTTLGNPLGVGSGGTGLAASPSMLVNLGSASAANVMQASPRPGVTGTLPVANGGTGASTVSGAPWIDDVNGSTTTAITRHSSIDQSTAGTATKYADALVWTDANGDTIAHDQLYQNTSRTITHDFGSVRQKRNDETWSWYSNAMSVAVDGTVTYNLADPTAMRNTIAAEPVQTASTAQVTLDSTLVTGSVRVRKVGHVAKIFVGNLRAINALTARTAIGTVPEGFRPSDGACYVQFNGTTATYMTVNLDGSITLEPVAAGSALYGGTCYLID